MTKKTKRTSPTARTLAELRKLGAVAQVTERWNPFAKIRQDLFGFVDVLALVGPNLIGIQVTSGTNHAHRRTKLLAEPRALAWLKTGALIEIHSWEMQGGRGKAKRWKCRKEAIVLADFAAAA